MWRSALCTQFSVLVVGAATFFAGPWPVLRLDGALVRGGIALHMELGSARALAQPRARPAYKGKKSRIVLDSSPQRATVYWAAPGKDTGEPKDYGVSGYTPVTLTVPQGIVKILIEVDGFKPHAQELQIKRGQKFSFTLERAPRAGALDLRATAEGSAVGAEVFIDGVGRGTVPNVFELSAGRHQLEVKKDGFLPLSEWITLNEGEHRTRDVRLERDPGRGGAILVTAESGVIYVDGERRGEAPTLIGGISPGEHAVEIRREGAQPFRTIVKVEAGKQAVVSGGPAGLVGALRVLANEQDVEIFLDGTPIGKAPVELPAVQAGQHVVEGKKRGFHDAEEVVKLVPGEQILVRLRMEKAPESTPKGMLSVKSAVPNAEVFLDGASLGAAPVERRDLEPGKHFVVVRKKGFRDYTREVMLEENRPVSVVAELLAVARVKFLSNPPGAQVFIDDEPIEGVTPTVKDEVAAGEHQITFRLRGYDEERRTVKIEGGEDRIVSADLVRSRTGPTTSEVNQAKMGASTWGAKALPKGGFAADVGMGYPYWLFGRLTVHAWQATHLRIDAGVEMRSYLTMWEFNLHSRAQFFSAGPFSLGARAAGGGGPGPNGRTSWSVIAGPLFTMSFSNLVHFTADASVQYYNDRVCPTQANIAAGLATPRSVCTDASVRQQIFDGKDPIQSSFSDLRLFVGGALEVVVNRYLSAWVKLDFLPAQYDKRVAYQDAVNWPQFEIDQLTYVMGGATLKL